MSTWREAGNTAVVTGGASGLGLEAARQFAAAGMNVVIADCDNEALAEAKSELEPCLVGDAGLVAKECDVSDLAQLECLRDVVYAQFGGVHCLMNNAGIGIRVGAPWENHEDLQRTLASNLWGVINGCHAFVPRMLQQDEAAVIINTGSKQGITRPPGNYAYNLSKAGVVAYTESVAHAFATRVGCKLSAHLLVPGFVYTSMIARHVPQKPLAAWTAEQTITFMLPCIDRGDFYVICPDNETTREVDERRIQWNADDLIRNRPALSRWLPEYKDTFDAFMQNG